LRISYFVPPAPLVSARERGLLAGIALDESLTPNSAAQLAGLLSGELDLVVTAIDNLFEWSRTGAELRLLGQVEATTPLSLIAAPGIRSLAELDGRTIGVDAYDNGFALVARDRLQRAGVRAQWIEVGGVSERFEALADRSIAATLLGPPFEERARAAGFVELFRVQDEFPTFPGQGLVARADVLGTPEFEHLFSALCASGLLPVEREGLNLLIRFRSRLGLLPPNFDLSATLVHEDPSLDITRRGAS
jgi:ABC-type nitrate/sulfonate/bicarbonate transport system substrate-binding protein